MSRSLSSTRKRRKPAHRAKPTSRMRLTSISGLLLSTAIIGGGAFLGLSSVDGTYALWNNSVAVETPSLASGSMEVRVGDSSSTTWSTETAPYIIPTAGIADMFPGDVVRDTFLVKVNNQGHHLSSDISIRTAAAVPNGFEVRVAPGACTADLTGPVIDATHAADLGNWGLAGTQPICAQISMPANTLASLQGVASSGQIEFIITANQKQP